MNQKVNRILILIPSLLAVVAFFYFLASPVLMLPAEPDFARLTIGKSSVFIDGEQRVPFYGLHMLMQLTELVSVFVTILIVASSSLILLLSPFMAFIWNRALLVMLAFSAGLNLFVLGIAANFFSFYLESIAFASGGVAMNLVLVAVYVRTKMMKLVCGSAS